MSPPETASVSRSSLAQDWLGALRYWLRGRRGVAVVVASAVVLGAALNWSWLVAVGIAPLLLAALPCIAMCGLGLCMNRMTGGSCSTSQGTTEHASAPALDTAQRAAAPEPVERDPDSRPSEAGALPDASIIGSREEQLYVQKDGE
jgi:hypothetical protein